MIRGTAWLALILYVGAEAAGRTRFRRDPGGLIARGLNTLGCAALLAHVLCAFQFQHGWSHAAAYTDTARQTAALTGWSWGGGLYVNYAFALAWVVQVVRSWRGRTDCEPRFGRLAGSGIGGTIRKPHHESMDGRPRRTLNAERPTPNRTVRSSAFDIAIGLWRATGISKACQTTTDRLRQAAGGARPQAGGRDANNPARGEICVTRMFRAFALFMFLNGAVIFVPNPSRWLGLACCLTLATLWCWPRKRGS